MFVLTSSGYPQAVATCGRVRRFGWRNVRVATVILATPIISSRRWCWVTSPKRTSLKGEWRRYKDPAITRTTLMKVPTLSTLWDYIYRAMPWNAPKSLTPDEVYALLAYILNLGYVVEDDFVLSDANIRLVQQRMPNRNGMTRDHGLWSVSGSPDVLGHTCLSDCVVDTAVTSSLPAYAMNAHGNLAEQVRGLGARIRGNGPQRPLAQNCTASAVATLTDCATCSNSRRQDAPHVIR